MHSKTWPRSFFGILSVKLCLEKLVDINFVNCFCLTECDSASSHSVSLKFPTDLWMCLSKIKYFVPRLLIKTWKERNNNMFSIEKHERRNDYTALSCHDLQWNVNFPRFMSWKHIKQSKFRFKFIIILRQAVFWRYKAKKTWVVFKCMYERAKNQIKYDPNILTLTNSKLSIQLLSNYRCLWIVPNSILLLPFGSLLFQNKYFFWDSTNLNTTCEKEIKYSRSTEGIRHQSISVLWRCEISDSIVTFCFELRRRNSIDFSCWILCNLMIKTGYSIWCCSEQTHN